MAALQPSTICAVLPDRRAFRRSRSCLDPVIAGQLTRYRTLPSRQARDCGLGTGSRFQPNPHSAAFVSPWSLPELPHPYARLVELTLLLRVGKLVVVGLATASLLLFHS
jgi:hypothetical protein